MGEYNPDRPYVLGMQWAPLVKDPLLLDVATEVGYTFRADTESVQRVRLLSTSPPPGRPTRKELLVNLYRAESVAGAGPARKLVIPCASGELLPGAALAGGAATAADAVSNPSDPRYISLSGPTAAARFWFQTATSGALGALFRRRILDVSVLYVMTGPFAELTPAVTLGLERPSAGVNWPMDETLTGPAQHTGVTTVRRSRLGELNPWWSTAATPLTTKWRMPYSYAGNASPTSGLTAWATPGGTNINVRLQVTGAAEAAMQFQVHYLALEVTYGEENRVGGGGLDISDGSGQQGGLYYEIPMFDMLSYGWPNGLWLGNRYAVTVGQAYSGQLSVASPVPLSIDRLGALDELPSLRGVLLQKTVREGAVSTVQAVAELPAVVMYQGEPLPGVADSRSHAYLAQAVGTLSDRQPPGAVVQRIPNDEVGTYVWVRFYARHLPGTRSSLSVYHGNPADPWIGLGPRASISVDEFDALPEVADGWREVTLRLEPPYVADGGGGVTWWVFSSGANDESPWQVLGADAEPGSMAASTISDTTYGGAVAYATIDGNDDRSTDLTLMLVREMDAVTGLVVEPAVQPLTVIDEQCARPVDGIPTGLHYHRLSWDAINTAVVAGWGAYEVQRQDDTMPPDEWETIAQVTAPNINGVDDYEARVGVESRYRIRMVHRLGVPGPWSEPVAATIPAPGVTGTRVDVGVLILTSNHRPAANLAYVTNRDRTGNEEFTFPEAGQVELQAMFGRDYRVAMRPLERGGVEFTRTVLVNAAAVPAGTLDKGFRGLRDLAWDTVPYVCVRDEMDNRWLATLLVPSGAVRRDRKRGHIQLAQVTVVEATDTPAPVDGGPPPCEGLRVVGSRSSAAAEADDPAGIGWSPVVVDDHFDRDVPPGGWGASDEPGLPWQVIQGAAADVWVADGAGSISLLEIRSANPDFETDVAGWQVFGGTFVRSTAQAHQGAGSGLLTPDGTAETARVQSPQASGAAVGQDWRAVAWVRCAVARNVLLSINWFDAAGTYIGTSTGPATSVPANTWTPLVYTTTATLAGTARATCNVSMAGTPPASHLLYVDEAGIGRAPADKRVVTGPNLADVDVEARFRVSAMAVGQPIYAYLMGRDVNGSSYYRARLALRPNGTVGVLLERIDNGVRAAIGSEVTATDWRGGEVTYAPGGWIRLRFQIRGAVLRAAAWPDGSYFPDWTVQQMDTTYADAGRTGVRGGVASGILTSAVRLDTDDYQVREPMANVDIRAEVRTSGDLWNVVVEHLADPNPEFIRSGWSVDWNDADVCVDVWAVDYFYACAPIEELGIVRNQRRWLRAVYEQDVGGGVGRATLLTSLDGETWSQVAVLEDYPEPLNLDSGFFSVWVSGDVTVSRVEIRNGVDGPVLVAPDFEAQPKGTRVFVDARGARWEVDGAGICGTG
ncbi:hypothetical protein JMF97_28650 [Micromonospora fiedleri]|uniref:Minor tail protein n=1 Tax=Micromonospora fiedleri TaxID=1157498 RepID=A0ABS1UUY3_9ACTN|nr:hypothetical protein [Micromonospora fiedleri]MBL6280138.1 hypothetical protein [Micromonospora fiedleri]